jgi:peptide/nickel transport system ATP-binding protein
VSINVNPSPSLASASVNPDRLISVSNLSVSFARGGGTTPVVKHISFHVDRGECLAIVGESGSGKSVTARTLIGLAGIHAQIEADELLFRDRNLARLKEREWRELRGNRIGFVLQDALVSLDPIRPVGREVAEAISIHNPGLGRQQIERQVIALLDRVGIPDAASRARQLPSELSGGLRQRALIASAIASDPDLLIADEPTTALDVTVQAQVLALLENLKREGRGLLVISHDLAVVGRLADRIAVMNNGRIVETGPASQILFDPKHDYTKLLLAAVPTGKPRGARLSPGIGTVEGSGSHVPSSSEVVGRVTSVTKRFATPEGASRVAVENVSFDLRRGETLGIVGESGSGKTTVSRILLGLVQPDSGAAEIAGQTWSSLSTREKLACRRGVQVIYQDTLSSFDPRYTVAKILDEAIGVAGTETGKARAERAIELLGSVGLSPIALQRRPIEMSGGQRQRVAIARALAPRPKIIVCDEPVSALDVSIQAQVLDLLIDLQRQTGVSYLFISHDLSVISHMSDRVLVMKDGRVVEQGSVADIFQHPREPYTIELIAAIPKLDIHRQQGVNS